MPLDFRHRSAADPDAARLIAAMVAEINGLYGGDMAAPGMPSARVEDFAAPRGAFLVAYEDGSPVAAGGVKPLAPGIAEIKRMYVVPEARGRGLARRLLEELEAAARQRGYRTVRLDTGARQAGAVGLYTSAGYRPIPDYNANPYASFWGEKDLGAPGGDA